MFATRRALSAARLEAATWKGAAMALQSALVDLVEALDDTPHATAYEPSTQARQLLDDGYTVPVRHPWLSDPGSPLRLALRAAKKVLR